MRKINKTNNQFMILSTIGIVIMVICHLAGNIYKYFKLFPFVPIFVFVSGYFYDKEKEKNIINYILHKFKKLMIPFFIINIIYGIITTILRGLNLIYFGDNITIYNLFIQPFLDNNQFVFNFPMWFVPTLFLTHICYIVIRKIYNKINVRKYSEEILFFIFIILNCISIKISSLSICNYIIVLLRIMFFLPFYHFGYMYKNKLKAKDEKIPNLLYIFVLLIINILFYKIFGDLNYDLHEFADFNTNFILLPFVSSLTAILFYTRIAKILEKYIGNSKIIHCIGNARYSIMAHHLFALYLLNLVLYVMKVPNFDIEHLKTGWLYIYEVNGYNTFLQLIYVVIGIVIPILFKYSYDKIKEFLVKKYVYSKVLVLIIT